MDIKRDTVAERNAARLVRADVVRAVRHARRVLDARELWPEATEATLDSLAARDRGRTVDEAGPPTSPAADALEALARSLRAGLEEGAEA